MNEYETIRKIKNFYFRLFTLTLLHPVLDRCSPLVKNHDLHQTIVMVSHEEWHKQYFDRIIVTKDGVIETDLPGTPEGGFRR